jgi:4-carboxymuconolactone decarboxylase
MSDSKGPRFSKFEMGDLNEQQRRVAERIMKVSSAGLGGPYSILLRSPVLA